MSIIKIPAAIISALLVTAAKKDVRYYLLGIHFNNRLNQLETSDGHRLSVVNFDVAELDLTDLPENTIVQLHNKIPAKAETIAFDFSAKVATCTSLGGSTVGLIPFELTGGVFPAINRVIPTFTEDTEKGFIFCNADYIADACKQAKLLNKDKYNGLKLITTVNGAKYRLTYNGYDLNGYIMGMRE